MVISLHTTESPVSRAERNKINDNWQRIIAGLTKLQTQINILAGGEVDALLERLNKAVEDANIAVQQAIDANNTATQEAIQANNTALQTALQTVSNTLSTLQDAITNANNAATKANAATDSTNKAIQEAQVATQDARNAVSSMQNFVNQLGAKSEYNNDVQYFTNNIVTLNGSSFIARQDTKGNPPPTSPTTTNEHWQLIASKGAKGDKGDKGEKGADGKDGTGVNIIGELPSEDDLPSVGAPGEAYMIAGDLYVWQDNTNTWKNVGPIRGPQGKSAYELAVENGFEGTMEEWIESLKGDEGPRGPEGPPGPPGKDADLTEVTEQLEQLEQTTENHITNNDKHLQSGERSNWNNKFGNNPNYFDGDLNDLKIDGMYKGYNFTNGAEKTISTFLVKAYSPDWVIQIQHTIANRPGTYIRSFYNGDTWSPWRRLLDKNDYDELFTLFSSFKTKIASATTDKGVPTNADATGDQMAANIRAIPTGTRKANGTGTSSATNSSFTYKGGSAVDLPFVDITNLNFTPSLILLTRATGGGNMTYTLYTSFSDPTGYVSSTKISLYNATLFPNSPNHNLSHVAITGGYRLPVTGSSSTYSWYAYE